jgi:hypothetical protein
MGDTVEYPPHPTPAPSAALSDRDRLQEYTHHDCSMLSLLIRQRGYPSTPEACRRLIGFYEALLLPQWIERGLPLVDLFYGVAPPGAASFDTVQALQETDQADTMITDRGGEAVVVILTDDPQRLPQTVSTVHFTCSR